MLVTGERLFQADVAVLELMHNCFKLAEGGLKRGRTGGGLWTCGIWQGTELLLGSNDECGMINDGWPRLTALIIPHSAFIISFQHRLLPTRPPRPRVRHFLRISLHFHAFADGTTVREASYQLVADGKVG